MDYTDDKYNVFVRKIMWWEDISVLKTPIPYKEGVNYNVDDLVYDGSEDQTFLWQVVSTNGMTNDMVETRIEKTQDPTDPIHVAKDEQGIFELVITDQRVEGVDSLSVLYKRAFLQVGADEAAAKKFQKEFSEISLWQHMLNLFLNEVVPNHDFLLARNIRSVLESAFKEDKEGWIFVKKNDSDETLKYQFLDSKVSFKVDSKS